MADAKISGLTAGTPIAGDNFVIERGGIVNYKVAESVLENTVGTSLAAGTVIMSYVAPGTSGNVLTSNGTAWTSAANAAANGWIAVTDTWAYASASTITVPAGASTTYSEYSKVKFTQHGTTKYGYINPTSDTVLKFYAGSDFAIENTATYPITNIYYSNAVCPVGFPQYFNTAAVAFSTTYLDNGSGGAISSSSSYFRMEGRITKHFISVGACVKVGTDLLNYFVLPANIPPKTKFGLGGGVYGTINAIFFMSDYGGTNVYCITANNVADNASIANFVLEYEYLS